MPTLWKPNWDETKRHFTNWWNHEGMALAGLGWGTALATPRVDVPDPGPATSLDQSYKNAVWRAKRNLCDFARATFPLDYLPLANDLIGPGSLSSFLGATLTFAPDTVWFHPCIKDPGNHPLLRFDPENEWWKIHWAIIEESVRVAEGRYITPFPDLLENLDVLSALRGNQNLLMDLYERPEWVKEKLAEINEAYFEVYDRIYDLIKMEDGSSAYFGFQIWGPGRVADVQCDFAALIGTAQFDEFVVPALQAQCRRLDHTMFHVDGSQCLPHLDSLLGIEELGAIEWTPEPGQPWGGNPKWYGLYRRILEAGKSVQAVCIEPDEVRPLLDAVGSRGMYLRVNIQTEAQMQDMAGILESASEYR